MKLANQVLKKAAPDLVKEAGIMNPHGLGRTLPDLKEVGKLKKLITDRSKKDTVSAIYENPQGGYWHITITKTEWDGE